jgi:4'-phosphopantetheinyl transferase EntD
MSNDQTVWTNMQMRDRSNDEESLELDAPDFKQRHRDRRTERRTARRAARQLVKLVGRPRLDHRGEYGDDQAS